MIRSPHHSTALAALLFLTPCVRGQISIEAHSMPGLPPAGQGASVAPVLGNRDTLQPQARIANLDAGDLVAGITWWRFEGIFWVETYVGFLASPGQPTQVFEVPASLYFDDNIHLPSAISDGGVVVGTNLFFDSLASLPFRWSDAGGFEHLPLGAHGAGAATCVSADGALVGGSVQPTIFTDARAARWVDGSLQVLGPAGACSAVLAASRDGALLVGEHGPTAASVQATRWLAGVELGLAAVPGAGSSSARLVSDDGSVAVGRARVGGVDLLVRWTVDGSASVFTPPDGLSVQELTAISPDGAAVVGALTDQVPFQADQVPFLWRAGHGFRLIGERGLAGEYDLSRATDVSDDGRLVVGQLTSSVISNGYPPSVAFLWSEESGTQDLEEQLIAAGQPPRGLYDALAISGDGRRILASGTERPSPQDTTEVILEFALGPPLK